MKCPSNYTPEEYKNRNLIVTLEILDISERYLQNQSNLWYLCDFDEWRFNKGTSTLGKINLWFLYI